MWFDSILNVSPEDLQARPEGGQRINCCKSHVTLKAGQLRTLGNDAGNSYSRCGCSRFDTANVNLVVIEDQINPIITQKPSGAREYRMMAA